MFNISGGTFELIAVCIILSGYLISVLKKMLIAEDKYRVRNLFFLAIIVRLLWWFVYFSFIADSYPFMITDDFNYNRVALASHMSLTEGRNVYQTVLTYLYSMFGASSITGRIVNLFASLICVYPIAYIEGAVLGNRKYIATRLYAILPFMFMITSFEIKDILSMLFFISSIAVMLYLNAGGKKSYIALFVVMCVLSEYMRTGMGILVFGAYVLDIIVSKIDFMKRNQVIVTGFVLIIAAVMGTIVLREFFASSYYTETLVNLGQYMAGRDKSINSGSMFEFLIIDSPSEFWKIPLNLIFFITLPSSSEGVGRFFLDFGVYMRIFDVTLCLFGVYCMFRKLFKHPGLVISIAVPYCYLAIFQVITFREVIFIVPLLYILGVDYLSEPIYSGKKFSFGNGIIMNYRQMVYMLSTIIWTLFVLSRLIR